MPATLTELYDKRTSVWERMKEIRDRADADGNLPGEDEAAYTAAETELERLSKNIEREERAARLDRVDRAQLPAPNPTDDDEEQRGGPDDEAYTRAFELFVRHGINDLDSEHRQVLTRGFVSNSELRAQGVATQSAGGYLAPATWRDRIIEAADSIADVAAVSDLIQTDSGETINWPTEDDTANEGAILAENTQVTEQDVAWGTAAIGAHMYTSKLVRLSIQLLQDNAYDVDTRLPRLLGRRIGRAQNRHFTVGTGTAQPEGIVTNALVGKTGATGSAATMTWDDLIDLEMSVLAVYRDNGRYMLSDDALKVVRKLRENGANGAYLWQPAMQAGQPSTINGKSYVVNNYMPAPAANAKSVLFGDFREGFLVRRVRDVQLLRLAERYADYLQVGFIAFNRADSKPQNSQAYKAYRHSAA